MLRPHWHLLVANLLLAVAVLIAFWPVLDAGFINYDDPDYITENPQVQAGLTLGGLKWAFTTVHASNWHPLTWLSHMADVQFFGNAATGPHAVNLLLHGLNTLLLFQLLRKVTGAHNRSLFVAALFGLHPLHVESVAWIAERKDVLSMFFGLLTLLAYARYVAAAKDRSLKAKLAYALALGCFLFGLMSKPMLVTLPFVMLLLDFWPLGRCNRPATEPRSQSLYRLIPEKLPFLLLTAISCLATLWAQRAAMQPLAELPWSDRLSNAAMAYARYLGKAIWPAELALPYVRTEPWLASDVCAAALILLGLSAASLWLGRRFPYLITGWLWFLITLVPVIGLVQVGVQTMADRYMYLPLIGPFVAVVWGGTAVARFWRMPLTAAGGLGLIALIAFATITRRQSGYWRDSETLFKHSAAVTENNYLALSNVAGSLFEHHRLDEALDYYQRAIRINPRHADALNSIGAVLAAQGSDEAIDWYHRALAAQPNHADALFNLGNAMAKLDRHVEALEFYERALQVQPVNAPARNNLGNSLLKLGKTDAAVIQYRRALEDHPNDATALRNLASVFAARGQFDEAIPLYQQSLKFEAGQATTHYGLGLALAVKGRWEEAIEHYRATLKLSPTNAEAEYNLGYACQVSRQLDEAAAHLSAALRLRPEFPLAHFNLACVLAESGQRQAAIHHLQEALRLQPAYAEAELKLRELTRAQRE